MISKEEIHRLKDKYRQKKKLIAFQAICKELENLKHKDDRRMVIQAIAVLFS